MNERTNPNLTRLENTLITRFDNSFICMVRTCRLSFVHQDCARPWGHRDKWDGPPLAELTDEGTHGYDRAVLAVRLRRLYERTFGRARRQRAPEGFGEEGALELGLEGEVGAVCVKEMGHGTSRLLGTPSCRLGPVTQPSGLGDPGDALWPRCYAEPPECPVVWG